MGLGTRGGIGGVILHFYLVTISIIEWEEEKRGSLDKSLPCLCVHHIIFWEIGLGNGGALK